jgi:hypothetical protein
MVIYQTYLTPLLLVGLLHRLRLSPFFVLVFVIVLLRYLLHSTPFGIIPEARTNMDYHPSNNSYFSQGSTSHDFKSIDGAGYKRKATDVTDDSDDSSEGELADVAWLLVDNDDAPEYYIRRQFHKPRPYIGLQSMTLKMQEIVIRSLFSL